MRVGIICNMNKDINGTIAKELFTWLHERGIDVLVDKQLSHILNAESTKLQQWTEEDVEFAVVLGGDGTLLRAAKRTVGSDIPLLGVNLGRLGFLTEVEVSDLYKALPDFLEGDYLEDSRHFIDALVYRGEGDNEHIVDRHLALNDVVIGKGSFSRMISVSTWVDNSLMGTYPADGVILSTATGSTAYSLSAGGPVIHPELEVLVVTPVCPHSFTARPVVLSREQVVRVEATPRVKGKSIITVDGNEGRQLESGEFLQAQLSEQTVTLLRREEWNFYEVLRYKLSQSEGRTCQEDL